MAFTVKFSDETTTDYPENAKFKIQENGVLVISGGSNRVYFAPHAWTRVEQEVTRSNERRATVR